MHSTFSTTPQSSATRTATVIELKPRAPEPASSQKQICRPPALIKIETQYTRDARVPLVAGDEDFNFGWQNIPLPPTNDGDWQIFDTGDNKRTGWRRIYFWRDDQKGSHEQGK